MMKTAFKIIGATAIVAGAYLYSRKETPEEFVQRAKTSFEDKKQKAADWKTAYQDFKNSMDQFKSQLPALEKTISGIQRDIDDAMFQIEPRLDEINKYSEKLK
jgi:chromosome segregation ATPase